MRRTLLPFVGDLAVLAVFVLLGRAEHDSGSSVAGYFSTLAPFAIALVGAWFVLMASKRNPILASSGASIWVITLVAGMTLRRIVFGDGIALPFIIVAAAFTALGIIGWRAIATRIPQAA